MGLARSSYYYRARTRGTQCQNVELLKLIRALREKWPAYGYRRITHQLQREGLAVNHKRVARLMRLHALKVQRPARRFALTSDGAAKCPYPNLARGLVPSRPDELWVADLTYIAVRAGFAFFAAILDAFSRRVVGYALGRHMGAGLTLAALHAAIEERRPPPGCIHHSDRGSQYGSLQYRELLARHGLKGSMGRRGRPRDNAQAESFMKTVKYEEIYVRSYDTFHDVLAHLPEFIEEVYNRERLHSALGYMSPIEFEAKTARHAA